MEHFLFIFCFFWDIGLKMNNKRVLKQLFYVLFLILAIKLWFDNKSNRIYFLVVFYLQLKIWWAKKVQSFFEEKMTKKFNRMDRFNFQRFVFARTYIFNIFLLLLLLFFSVYLSKNCFFILLVENLLLNTLINVLNIVLFCFLKTFYCCRLYNWKNKNVLFFLKALVIQ